MRRTDSRLLVSIVLLATAFITFGTGLVLFVRFHIDGGVFREVTLGASRLTWLNLHRLAALVVAVGLSLHVALNWKAFLGVMRRGLFAKRRSGAGVELVLYAAFGTATIAGIIAWLLVSGSAPLQGPVPLGPLPHTRHQFIDIHNCAGLVALPLSIHHVGHRWGQMVRRLLSWARRMTAARAATASTPAGRRLPVGPPLTMATEDKEI